MLVRTIAGAISIGAELPQIRGNDLTDPFPIYPKETGYESYAQVLAVGTDVTQFQVGDRLLAFYGHRDVALVEASKAIPVPDGISAKLALLNILSCDVAKGVRKLAPLPTDSVLVTGMGVMGLLTFFYLRHYYQVERIIVSEPDPVRAALALRLGATIRLPTRLRMHSNARPVRTLLHCYRRHWFLTVSSVSCRTGITRRYR